MNYKNTSIRLGKYINFFTSMRLPPVQLCMLIANITILNTFIFHPVLSYTFIPVAPTRKSLNIYLHTKLLLSSQESNEDETKPLPPLYIESSSMSSYQKSKNVGYESKMQVFFQQISKQLYGTNTDISITSGDINNHINKKIVIYGQRFKKMISKSLSYSSSSLVSTRDQVPGCIATVHIQTILIPINNTHHESTKDISQFYRIQNIGTADALLSQGLLAILSVALSGDLHQFHQIFDLDYIQSNTNDESTSDIDTTYPITAKDILMLNPDTFTDQLQLRSLLSTGRNDGLASMLRTVQNQIKTTLAIDIHSSHTIYNQQDSKHKTKQESQTDEKLPYKPSVAVLLSGGVDSSVALNLLVRQNYNVTAFYLKIWLEDELAHLGQCPWEDDYNTCVEVCKHAYNTPLETISLQQEYKNTVIQYTVQEAKKGRTPNPDIMCNSRIKFGCFYNAIEGRGYDYVATGHYAQLVEHNTPIQNTHSNHHTNIKRLKKMRRAPDAVKDQSYFLSMLTQEQLSNVLFPIGKYTKKEVRQLAHEFDLPNKDRPESQGLCFLGKVKFEEFLGAYLGENPGDIINAATFSNTELSNDYGTVLGQHKGLWFHTVGQRKGIGKLLHPKATAHGPWYIVAKDIKRNALLASNQYDQDVFATARSEFYVEDLTWIAGIPPKRILKHLDDPHDKNTNNAERFSMKIRHGPTIVQGTLEIIHSLHGNIDIKDIYTLSQEQLYTHFSSGKIILDKKDGGLAPGQFVVFYGLEEEGDEDDMECLGAGVISEKHWAHFLTKSDSQIPESALNINT